MIAKVFAVLCVLVGAALANDGFRKPMAGLDPNTLSCDPLGQEFLLLPHFTDCSSFFMCAHGEEVLFHCSGGLIFDFELQGCNWVWDTRCFLRDSHGGGGDNSKESPERSDSKESSESSSESSSKSSSESSSEEKKPSSEERPQSSEERPQSSEERPKSSEKEHSSEDCEGSGDFGSGDGSGEMEWIESEPEPEILGPQALGLASRQAKVHEADHEGFSVDLDCTRADSAARHVAYRGDCQRYWRCVEGVTQAVYCSDGLFFNEKTSQCDFEANVRCEINHDYELEGEFLIYHK